MQYLSHVHNVRQPLPTGISTQVSVKYVQLAKYGMKLLRYANHNKCKLPVPLARFTTLIQGYASKAVDRLDSVHPTSHSTIQQSWHAHNAQLPNPTTTRQPASASRLALALPPQSTHVLPTTYIMQHLISVYYKLVTIQ